MSNPYSPRVQQKIAHSRLLLQRLLSGDEIERQGREALLQGAVVHLAVACRLYLREVGHHLLVRNPERIFQLSDLVEVAGDAAVVEELKEQPWLPSLFAAEREVLNPQLALASAPQLIAFNTITETVELSVERVQELLTSLTGLVEQQRLLFAEY